MGSWLGVDPRGFSMQWVRGFSIGKDRTRLLPEEAEQVLEIAGSSQML